MARKFATSVEFDGNQALNVRLHQSAGDLATLTSGKVWFDTNKVRPVWAAGTSVVNDIYPFASANTANTGVLRDGSGNFTAGVGSFTSVTLSGSVTNNTDAATKAYVDALVQGLDLKNSCRCATTTTLPAYTYSATAGGTLTANAFGAFPTIDTTVTLTAGQSILVKDETAGNAKYNGIYTLDVVGDGSTAWVLTRRADANSDAKVTSGMYTFVSEGTVNADNGYALMTLDPISLNVTALAFSQFSGAGQITAGMGLYKSGNTIQMGTGVAGSYANGVIPIGNGTGFTYSTLTQGTGITITNTAGVISIAATNAGNVTGSGVSGQAAFWTGASAVGGSTKFLWNDTSGTMTLTHAATEDGLAFTPRSGGTGSFITTLTTGTLSGSYTMTIPATTAGDTFALLGLAQTFTGGPTISTANLTITDVNVVLGTTTGTKIGTSTSQKLSFYNSTPIVQPTGDVATALSNLGLIGTPTISATTALDGTFVVNNTSDQTKQFKWSLGAQATGSVVTLTTLATQATATLNIPVITTSDTLAMLGLGQTFTGANVFQNAGTKFIAAATQDAITIAPRAGGTGSFITSIATGTLTGSYTMTLPATAGHDTFCLLGLAQTITGAKSFTTSNLTITDVNIVLSATTGTQFGTATTQKLGFYGATAVVQPIAQDVATALTTLGLMATGGTYAAGSVSGTLAINHGGTGLTSTSQNYAFLGPVSGGAGAPTWRAIDAADLPAAVTKKYAVDVGDGASLSYVISHGLGSLDVTVQVYDKVTLAQVECDVVHTSTSQVTLTFTTIPTGPSPAQYRVVVVG